MSKAGSSGGNSGQGDSDWPKHFPPIPRNRFQKSGNKAVYEVKDTKECLIYRIDMPGCLKSDLVYWIDDNKLHFFADEPAMPEYNHRGRKYGGTLFFETGFCVVNKAQVDLLNGVLWVIVPKEVPGLSINLEVTEKVLTNVRITREDVA